MQNYSMSYRLATHMAIQKFCIKFIFYFFIFGGGGGVVHSKCLWTYSTGSGSLYSNEENEVAKAQGNSQIQVDEVVNCIEQLLAAMKMKFSQSKPVHYN